MQIVYGVEFIIVDGDWFDSFYHKLILGYYRSIVVNDHNPQLTNFPYIHQYDINITSHNKYSIFFSLPIKSHLNMHWPLILLSESVFFLHLEKPSFWFKYLKWQKTLLVHCKTTIHYLSFIYIYSFACNFTDKQITGGCATRNNIASYV